MKNEKYAVSAVISGLSASQAERLTKNIMKSKRMIAPGSRGTIGSMKESALGRALANSVKQLGGK